MVQHMLVGMNFYVGSGKFGSILQRQFEYNDGLAASLYRLPTEVLNVFKANLRP